MSLVGEEADDTLGRLVVFQTGAAWTTSTPQSASSRWDGSRLLQDAFISIGFDMIDWKEIPDGDTWELFARDFLAESGFVIDQEPGRGPDGGRDIVVSEQLQGTLRTEKFTWLVSCKHKAHGGASVGTEEYDITDRLKRNNAQGFMGFYSTVPSNGLVTRLDDLLKRGEIRAYEIFDGKKIEARFVAAGMSTLALRYVPSSYGRMRPIQKFFGKYKGLHCNVCNKDVLAQSITEPFKANLVWAAPYNDPKKLDALYIACKDTCDHRLDQRLHNSGFGTSWEDLGDLCNPLLYIKNVLTYTNMLHSGQYTFTSQAHEKMKDVYLAVAQRTLREVTKEDEDRFKSLQILEGL
jgi:hypothetical protein